MTIKDKRKDYIMEFKELEYGDVFDYCDEIWIKTQPIINPKIDVFINAVNLKTGAWMSLSDGAVITPIMAAMVIEE